MRVGVIINKCMYVYIYIYIAGVFLEPNTLLIYRVNSEVSDGFIGSS